MGKQSFRTRIETIKQLYQIASLIPKILNQKKEIKLKFLKQFLQNDRTYKHFEFSIHIKFTVNNMRRCGRRNKNLK